MKPTRALALLVLVTAYLGLSAPVVAQVQWDNPGHNVNTRGLTQSLRDLGRHTGISARNLALARAAFNRGDCALYHLRNRDTLDMLFGANEFARVQVAFAPGVPWTARKADRCVLPDGTTLIRPHICNNWSRLVAYANTEPVERSEPGWRGSPGRTFYFPGEIREDCCGNIRTHPPTTFNSQPGNAWTWKP